VSKKLFNLDPVHINQEIQWKINSSTKFKEVTEANLAPLKLGENSQSLLISQDLVVTIQNIYRIKKMGCTSSNQYQKEKEFSK
jgi:hypothetical protein